jgi:alanine or glycine:cation symporter, AGCS family
MLPESIGAGIQSIANALFVPYLLVLLFGAGIFLTFRYRFLQVRRLREALREFVAAPDQEAAGSLSPFQAFMTALAATIGTGNIAGVAAGIVSGGPGALFWIWCYGFVATTVKFSEAVLGVRFRETAGAETRSGPMYYLRDGLRSPALAWTYAAVAGLAALTTTPFTQTNSIALVWQTQAGVPLWLSGVIVAVLTWLVIIGGIQSIGRAAGRLTPLKVGLYLSGGLFVIVVFAARIPEVLALVVREAFSTRAAAGGTLGFLVAMRFGLARGMYANEAGYGTAAVAYGTARSGAPVSQGLNAVMEVFIVSFVTSTISAMTILLTGAWQSGQTSTAAVALAFDAALPGIGGWVVAFCVFLFGYTTLIGWAYYGEQFLAYVLGPAIAGPYRWAYCLLIPLGAVTRVEVVWAWGDLMNALQIFPNIIGVLGLSGLVAKLASDHRR